MNLKRSLALAISLLMLLTLPMPAAVGADALPRLSGADRYETAVEISKAGWASAPTVVMARGDHYADALAGVPLAHKLGSPILLTQTNSLPKVTKDEIVRLGANKVVILGGTGAISAAVADELTDLGLFVERISGEDRYDTAAKIASKVNPDAKTVVLASGLDFPDALAAAPYAAAAGYPILLSATDSIPAKTMAALKAFNLEKVIVVGGTSALSANVFNAVSALSPVRVSGANRFATSVALADFFGLDANHVYVASGLAFPDAITGAALAAKQGTGLLLVGNNLDNTVGNYLTNNNVADATIFGGTSAVSATVASAIANKLAPKDATGITGWVTSEGTGLASATVAVGGRSVTTDAYGFYRLTGLSNGTATTSYSRNTWSTVTEAIGVTRDKVSVRTDIALDKLTRDAIEVKGTFVDAATSAPVGGYAYDGEPTTYESVIYRIQYFHTGMNKWITVGGWRTADPDTGCFELVNADAFGGVLNFGMKVRVQAFYVTEDYVDQYHFMTKEMTLKQDSIENVFTDLKMTQVKRLTLSGSVTDRGYEVANAYVVMLDSTGAFVLDTETDSEGYYEFRRVRLTSDDYIVIVYADGLAVNAKKVSLSEGVDKTHNVAMERGYSVSFAVQPQEHDVSFPAGAYEAYILQNGNYVSAQYLSVAPAASEIVFDFEEDLFAPGKYTILVEGDGLVSKEFAIEVRTAAYVGDFARCALGAAIKGEVWAEELDGINRPQGNATVELFDRNGKLVETATTNSWGEYAFRNLKSGTYNVKVTKEGFRDAWWFNPNTSAGQEVAIGDVFVSDFDLVYVPVTGEIAGYVRTTGTNAPAVGAVLYYLATGTMYDPVINDYWKAGQTVRSYTIEADGSYTFNEEAGTDLPTGLYRVVIKDPGKHEYNVGTRYIAAGDNGDTVNYFLQPGGNAKLTINVTNVNADIYIYDAYGRELHPLFGTIMGEELGSATGVATLGLTQLSAGNYTVAVSATDYVPQLFNVTVTKSGDVTKNIKLVPKSDTASVQIPVFGKDNASLSGFYKINNVGKNSFTESISVFLEKGTYTISIYVDEYYEHTVRVTVKDDDLDDVIYVPVVQLNKWK